MVWGESSGGGPGSRRVTFGLQPAPARERDPRATGRDRWAARRAVGFTSLNSSPVQPGSQDTLFNSIDSGEPRPRVAGRLSTTLADDLRSRQARATRTAGFAADERAAGCTLRRAPLSSACRILLPLTDHFVTSTADDRLTERGRNLARLTGSLTTAPPPRPSAARAIGLGPSAAARWTQPQVTGSPAPYLPNLNHSHLAYPHPPYSPN